MPELSESTQKLIQKYQSWYQSLEKKEGVSTIQVDEVASKVASFYEKMRGIIDWRDEHLFRKGAIERVLKRRVFFLEKEEKIAQPLILELIRGGHYPNDKIEESKIEEIQRIVDKYLYLSQNSPLPSKEKLKIRLFNWILEIASSEIEEVLSSPSKETTLMDYMTEVMEKRVKVKEGVLVIGGLNQEEKNKQIFIAVQKTLFSLDESSISYNLLKRRYPNWKNLSAQELSEISQNIYSIWKNIEKDLNHRLASKFYKVCEKYDTPYLILGDILTEDPMGIKEKISKPEILESKIKEFYQKRAKNIKIRLNRAAFFATFSIFISNVFSLILIEFPLAKLVWGEFTFLGIAVNVLGPTFLMYFLIATIKLPKKENIDITVMETMKIVYQNKNEDIYEMKIYPPRGAITKALVTLFYLTGFGLVCWLISWLLFKIHLPVTTHFVFIIFISLISFAGMKIRRRVKELEMIEEKEGVFYFLVDLFAIPIAQLGKWLTSRWKKINVISNFFNYLIDYPFQIFTEFLEQWRYFLKEKKDEIY